MFLSMSATKCIVVSTKEEINPWEDSNPVKKIVYYSCYR